jgi:hypothetical protein
MASLRTNAAYEAESARSGSRQFTHHLNYSADEKIFPRTTLIQRPLILLARICSNLMRPQVEASAVEMSAERAPCILFGSGLVRHV